MATLTITLENTKVARIQRAFGRHLGLGRDANTAELRQFIIARLKEVVRAQEWNEEAEKIALQDDGIS